MPMMVSARRISTLATTLAIVVACTNARCAHAQRKGGKQDTSYGEVIITEISYEQASPEDALVTEIAGSDDWVELYNPSKTLTVNLTGFALTDLTARKLKKARPEKVAKHLFVLPENTIIAPKSFAVIARDEMAYREAYAEREVAIGALVRGSFRFGLSAKGETIRILDRSNATVFELKYDDKGTWPNTREAGHSLELVDVRQDPNDSFSWIASSENGGTPGEVNSVAVSW